MEAGMANIKSAKKRIRVIEKKTQRNRRVKTRLKEILKDLETAIADRDKETAREKLALAEKKLMQAAAKGTVHQNTASRKISRITAAFKSAFGQESLLEKANKPAKPVKTKKEEPAPKEAVAETIEEEAVTEAEAVTEEPKKKPARKRSTKKESAEEAPAETAEPAEAAEDEAQESAPEADTEAPAEETEASDSEEKTED
jgi:small subunit ribosomal protein S20